MFTVPLAQVGQLPSPESYVVEPSVAVTTLIIFFIMVLACAIPGKFSWFGHDTGCQVKKGVR